LKIFSVVGARPQFIKLAPLSAALSGQHEEIIVHTGQHYDYTMSEKIFKDLAIRKPDIHLETGSGTQAVQTGNIMVRLESVMKEHKPDIVLVFGDTNSTLAGALAASKLNISIIHIEAGLRSFNKMMPEEINRIIADHISNYLFAPTQTAADTLKKEGLIERTFLTGDIMVDTLKNNLEIALKKSTICSDLKVNPGDYNLLTLHRNYNVDDRNILENILTQLNDLEERIIFPVHPRTRKMLTDSISISAKIQLTEPLGYLDFITLENFSKRIITDSGGIQKEAYILRKPCITLRPETEWIETVHEKWNLLVNPNENQIASKITSFEPPKNHKDLFGRNVARKMVEIINNIIIHREYASN
jgi:UDP-GlcNAc3NAcA epimerase